MWAGIVREGGLRWAKYKWEKKGTIRTEGRQCYVNLKTDILRRWFTIGRIVCSFLPSFPPASSSPPPFSSFLPPSTNVYQVPDTELYPGHARTKKSRSSSLRSLQSSTEKQNRRSGGALLVRSECFAKVSMMLLSQLTWYLVVLGSLCNHPLCLSSPCPNRKAFKDTDCLYFIFISICGSASHRVASLHWCVQVRLGWNQSGGGAVPLQPRAVHFLQDAHPSSIFIPENVTYLLDAAYSGRLSWFF